MSTSRIVRRVLLPLLGVAIAVGLWEATVLGYQLPGLWLMRKTTKRQKEIQNGVPDLLDLLIVCLEAGSALDQAITLHARQGSRHRRLLNRRTAHQRFLRQDRFDRQGEHDWNVA